jgi:hypothetical protein
MEKTATTFQRQCSWKRIMSFCMALVLLLALLPAGAFTAKAAENALYLVPSSEWKADNARFAAYFFGAGETWIDLTDTDADGIYEGTIPSGGYTNVIFCRMNPATTDNNWDNKWTQTGDLQLQTGMNCYTMNAGWDGTGTWSFYEITPPETDPPETDPPETEAPTTEPEAPSDSGADVGGEVQAQVE